MDKETGIERNNASMQRSCSQQLGHGISPYIKSFPSHIQRTLYYLHYNIFTQPIGRPRHHSKGAFCDLLVTSSNRETAALHVRGERSIQ